MNDCLFCQIANGDPSKLVWQNEHAAAFKDIHPKAPTHILVVPKRHVPNLNELNDEEWAGQLLMAVRAAAEAVGLDHYRLIVNNGKSAGQVIEHLHFHVLGGKTFTDAEIESAAN